MKILAVIPARAGSKGIPNKNIRFVNGKPLIWYAIMNAQKSKYITDIVVTTDSKEVEIIAQQLNVSVRQRDPALCQDDVTLDAVIYDAIGQGKFDYIVTMQPTSPTLHVETLDKAIDYSIKNDLDTVISAVNAPHLSWREEEGHKVPNYTERLNRQYLPPNYLETGAFVISKAEIVTAKTRIGYKVDVYEVSDSEAIDIDSFNDLRCAEAILEDKKVAFYVNGNNLRGMGHVYRTLELADEFYSKPDIYYDIHQTDRKIFGKTMHNLIGVDGEDELLECLKEKQYDIIINDVLNTTMEYVNSLKNASPKAKIINFEDAGEGIYKADLVVNAMFQDVQIPHVKCGERYYIAPRMFMFYGAVPIREKVKTVIIAFGGADPQNYTDRLLKMISTEKYKDYTFKVVLGRAKKNVEELLKYNAIENIEVLYDIKNMPEIMSHCDLGVTSRGRTGYELALLGIPTIAMAQNKREETHGFICKENGYSYLGLNPTDHTIEAVLDMYLSMDKEERLEIQKVLQGHDLRNGRQRVMNLINN